MRNFFLLAILAMLILACENGAQHPANTQDSVTITQLERGVEVLYFHGKKRCSACNAIEALSKEVIAQQFATEVQNGTVVFHSIDFSDPVHKELVNKYTVAFSSLLLVRHKDGKEVVVNLSKLGFTKANIFPDDFKQEFAEKLTKAVAKSL